jgi:hypothetical protein
MWRAHDHVVLGESSRWRKGCVDLQCGHDQVVCNVMCSSSCSIRRIELTNEGMCWSPMWAWSSSMHMWRVHDHVVLGELNRWRKVCVDLQCGHDRGVCNITCSWSCITKPIESTKEGMCWSRMWAWSKSIQRDMLIIL